MLTLGSIISCVSDDPAHTVGRIESLLSTRIFRVERRHYHASNGAFKREVIVHPGAVVILALLNTDRVVMIHNRRHTIGRELLELPAGTLEPGEAPLDCARREIHEETGYRANKITPLCEFYTTPGICTERMHAFVAQDLTYTRQQLDPNEHIRVELMALDRIADMICNGQIEDGKTIATLATFILRGLHP